MSNDPISLGDFDLVHPVGRGGMGEVWKAVHRASGLPAAVKVIGGGDDRVDASVRAIEAEIRAVARLDHPAIVMALDTGKVSKQAEAGTRGALVAGSPFLVMEFASGGSLASVLRARRGPTDWAGCFALLETVLEGLAHAHARGVLHRDLKPGNLLLATERDLRPGLKITDFGLADAILDRESGGNTENMTGTAIYMAPEQLRGHWRDYGPWTDLFAVGCLGFQLATGQVPFAGSNPYTIVFAHLSGERAPFRPLFDHPAGLEAWVDRLLEIDPANRPLCAADALRALRALKDQALRSASRRDHSPAGEVAAAPPAVRPAAMETLDTASAAPTVALESPPRVGPRGDPHRATLPVGVVSAGASVPRSWRHRHTPPPDLGLRELGLRLFGLREAPFVGRDRERTILWRALRKAADGAPQVVVLRGGPGAGKSRLAEWLGRRASELGLATVLRAEHGAVPGPALGLPRMFARQFRCLGLSAESTLDRARELLSARGSEWAHLAEPLAAFLAPSVGDAGEHAGASPRERQNLMLELCSLLAVERPLVVILEDVHWGAEALDLVRAALTSAQHRDLPLLALLTVRDQPLGDGGAEVEALAHLEALHGVRTLDLQPLGDGDLRALLDRMLGLTASVTEAVLARSSGNPLFALELLGTWVAENALSSGPAGFELRDPNRVDLPRDVHALWVDRLARALASEGATAHRAMEIGAALGRQVDLDEWLEACELGGIGGAHAALEAMLSAGLADEDPLGWSFCHPMLVESLERTARDGGRWPDLNRLCAQMLEELHPPGSEGIAERRARFLRRAGAVAEACEALLAAAEERLLHSDYAAASQLLDQRDQCLHQIGAPAGDARRGPGAALALHLLIAQGRYEDANTAGTHAVEAAIAHGWTGPMSRLLRHWGLAAGRLGRTTVWQERAEQALESARAMGDVRERAECLLSLATVAGISARPDEATSHAEQALDLFRQAGHARGVGESLLVLSRAAQRRGDAVHAVLCARRALAEFESVGSAYTAAVARNTLGDLLRYQGRVAEAVALYEEAIDALRRLGSFDRVLPLLNLGQALGELERSDEAEQHFREGYELALGAGQAATVEAAAVLLLGPVARRGDWPAWDRYLAASSGGPPGFRHYDRDLARAALDGARAALDAGQAGRAAGALDVAKAQVDALGPQAGQGELDELTEACRRAGGPELGGLPCDVPR